MCFCFISHWCDAAPVIFSTVYVSLNFIFCLCSGFDFASQTLTRTIQLDSWCMSDLHSALKGIFGEGFRCVWTRWTCFTPLSYLKVMKYWNTEILDSSVQRIETHLLPGLEVMLKFKRGGWGIITEHYISAFPCSCLTLCICVCKIVLYYNVATKSVYILRIKRMPWYQLYFHVVFILQ